MKTPKKGLAIIALVILVNSFFGLYQLGSPALTDYDEATYALVVEETAASGQIGTLKIADDRPWFEKPPLYFWLVMAIKDAFGSNPEWPLRLPAALLGMASTIGVMLITWRLTDNYYIAALSGAILATTPIFVEASRQVRLDVPAIATIIWGFYCFLRGMREPRWLLGVGLFAAIGVLFKSMVGFFIFPFIIIWSFVHRSYGWLKERYFGGGLLAMILLLAPWHIYESVTVGRAFWDEYLLWHIVERFFSDIIGSGAPAQNYFVYLFSHASPWSIIFAIGLFFLYGHYRQKSENGRNIIAFFAISLFVLAVFEIARTKLFYYLLPMFPFMALALAFFLHDTYQRIKNPWHKKIALVAFLLILAGGIANTAYIAFHKEQDLYINQLIANEEKQVGLTLAKGDVEKTYVYQYPYLETIRYYSRGRPLEEMKDDQELTDSFNLIMSKPFYDRATFPPELAERLKPLYVGESIILLRFEQ